MKERDLVLYQFSRLKVEGGDFGNFLSLYALDKLPTGRRLRDMMNGMVFCIEGWGSDPREVHTIPEIRRFYSTFHEAWPYWLYFANLDVDTLKAMTMCCLPTLSSIQVAGQAEVKVVCDPLELVIFLSRDLAPMNQMCERAEMTERGIYDRTKAVFEYFGLPFDGGPPPE